MLGRVAAVCCAAAVCLASGCANWEESHTERSAVELMLLSTAARNAGAKLNLDAVVKGRKVRVDTANFKSTDREYAISCIRERLLAEGALLTSAGDAEIVVEARSGVLNNDHDHAIIGIPAIPVGIPGVGSTEIPELALWGKMSQIAWASFALAAYEKDSGRMIADARAHGTAYYNRYTLLFLITWSTSDIPERRRGAFRGLFPTVAD